MLIVIRCWHDEVFWIFNSIYSQNVNQGLKKFVSHTPILRKLFQNILQQSKSEKERGRHGRPGEIRPTQKKMKRNPGANIAHKAAKQWQYSLDLETPFLHDWQLWNQDVPPNPRCLPNAVGNNVDVIACHGCSFSHHFKWLMCLARC